MAAWDSDIELRARTGSWLRARLRGDRRRWPSVTARSRAFLQIVDLDRERARGRIDPIGTREFFHLLGMVERMAAGLPIYHLVEGEPVPMGEITDGADPRLRAFKRLLEITEIERAKFDDAADRIDAEMARQSRGRERGLRLAIEYVCELEKTAPKPQVASAQKPVGHGKRPRLKYDDSALRVIVAKLTERELDEAELLDLADEHLGDLGTDMHAEATDGRARPVEDSPTRRAALLRAVTEVYDQRSAAQRAAVKAKSKALASHPSGGDRVAYSARSTDLDAELIQPIREELEDVRELVIRYAVRLDPSRNWPAGNTQLDRALALGRALVVEDVELATARASLGLGSVGARAR